MGVSALDLRRRSVRDRRDLGLDGVDLDAEERGRAVSSWRGRMVSEYVSARVFAALVPQAMRASLPHRSVRDLTRMATEEISHAELCADVLVNLDAEPLAPMPTDLPDVPEHRDADPLEALLRNVIAVGCCSETVAVALVGAERELAATPALADLLRTILRDEVGHARFGWRLLEQTAGALSAAQRRRLSFHLVTIFRHQLATYTPLRDLPAASDQASSVGVMDGPRSFHLVAETLAKVTVPGLARHGLEADRALREATSSVAPEARASRAG